MRDDHYVAYRHEQSIAAAAEELRRSFGIVSAARFDITDILQRLTKHDILGKGRLEIVEFDMAADDKPALVTYNPLKVHIDREISFFAKLGDPYSRYILAHELGHIILHDHNAKAFSDNPDLQIKFGEPEHSAEWQATMFAAYFLLPNHIVRSLGDVQQLVAHCDVPEKLAIERLGTVKRRHRVSRQTGELCPTCGRFTLRLNGLSLRCDTCPQVENV